MSDDPARAYAFKPMTAVDLPTICTALRGKTGDTLIMQDRLNETGPNP